MGFFDGLGADREASGWRVGPRHDWSAPPPGRLDPFAYTDPDAYDVARIPGPDDEDDADDEVEHAPAFHPMPDEKPDPRAQWDGTSGCWTVYDESVGDWLPITNTVPGGEDPFRPGP